MKISIRVLGALAALVLLFSACTNQSPTSSEAAGTGAVGGTGPDPNRHLTFAVISHAAPGDPFWDVVKSGAEQAGKDLDISVSYNGDPDPTRQSQLIDNAVSQHVDGLIVSMANPDGVKDAVESAVKAGIPVVTMNSGMEESRAFGAITHVGQSEELAGEAAGKKMKELGAHKLICVIHEAGNVSLEQRCAGAKKGFGGPVDNIQVDVSNLADAQSTIRSKLTSDSSVDGVLTLNNGVAMAAVNAQKDAGTKAQIGTFDLDSNVLQAIQNGQLAFAVDQQPYVQGYLPVVVLALKNRNGNDVGGGQPIYSGPAFVTKENAALVTRFAADGTR